MHTLQVAYLLPTLAYQDAIDELVLQLIPHRRIVTLSEANNPAEPQHCYGIVLIRLYTADGDLTILLNSAARMIASGGLIVVIIPPQAEAHVVAAIDSGVGIDDYLFATPLQLRRLPRLIEHAATIARMAVVLDNAQSDLNLRAQRDITIRREAEEHFRQQHQHQQALSEVGMALADIRLNETVALQRAAQHVAQLLGDASAIMLMSDDKQQLEIAALYHPEPTVQELSRELFGMLQYAVDEPQTQVLFASGQPLLLNSEQIDQLPSIYQIGLQTYREQVGLHYLMLVPLWAQREIIGLMVAVRNQPDHPYTSEDLLFFKEIAEWTALSVANLRLFQAVQRELVARQIAEESLRVAEAHYRMLVEHLPLAISTIALDEPDARPYISPQIEALFGFSVAEWQAQPDLWRRQAHPDDLPGLQAAAASASNQGSFQYEHRQYHRDGHVVWIRYNQQIITVDHRRFLLATMRDITQRKQAEDALQQTQELYRVITETISDAIITIDQRGVILYANVVVETIFGHSYTHLVGQNLMLLIPDYLREIHRTSLQTYVETGQRHLHSWNGVQLPGLHRDGHQIPLEISFGDAWQDGRRIFTGIIHDITARKHAEALLQESNERYDLAVQGSSDGIWDWNVQTDAVYFSPRFRELIGYIFQPYYGSIAMLSEVVHPDDRERIIAAIMAHLKERIPFSIEYRLNTVANGYRWFLMRGQALWDAEGRPMRMAGSLTDIHVVKSAQKQLEELNHTLEQRIVDRTAQLERTLQDLRDSERHWRSVVTNAPIILSSIDPDGILTLSEGRGLALLGLTSMQGVGQSLFHIYQDRPDLLIDVRRALAGEHITTIREIGKHIFETWYTPLIESDGSIRGTISVSVDITARQQVEQELRERSEELARANRELARAARLKDEFLANMSHELRTPLTSILGRSELLQEDESGLLTEFQRRSVRSIEESGRHLLELINDILDLSKIEAGKLTLMHDSVNVVELCHACLRMIHSAAFKQQLTIHTSFDPAVVTITADERRLKQILVNLLSNAVKFTPAERTIGLEVRGDAVAQEAHFIVWDTGIGIVKADQERLFQPFTQIDSSLTRQYEGTGLGLVLVAHLTAMHHGRITLDSTPDQGSRFTITLPWIIDTSKRGQLVDSM